MPKKTRGKERKMTNTQETVTFDPLAPMVDAALAIEKLRVASEVRQSHLTLQGKTDSETDELHRRLEELEGYVDGRVAEMLADHPAYPWFSRVKGVGRENIGKVVGLVDINRVQHISSLWKFAGFAVENGAAPKRTKGEKLSYNSQLRSMCWRLGNSLLRARGCFYEYYLREKEKYEQRYAKEGRSIVPAAQLPKKSGKTYEPEDRISEGHVHNQALRKTIKLFLACLVLAWWQSAGMPASQPYAIDQLGHDSLITPEQMTDRPAKKTRKRKADSSK